MYVLVPVYSRNREVIARVSWTPEQGPELLVLPGKPLRTFMFRRWPATDSELPEDCYRFVETSFKVLEV